MKVHIARNGQPLGIFEEDCLTQLLEQGTVSYSDLAWVDGMNEWLPLRQITTATPAEPPPLPLPQTAVEGNALPDSFAPASAHPIPPPPVKPAAAYCTRCGTLLAAGATTCLQCGAPTSVCRENPNDPVLRMLLPIDRSWYAIIAGYLGLFAILGLPAPFAVLFGVLAHKDIKKNPEKGGKGRATFGIIIGGIFCAIYALMLILWILANTGH